MKVNLTKMHQNNFSFDEANHTYRLNGKEIPSVTQILSEMGFYNLSVIPEHILINAQRYGSALHKACELYDKRTLDWTTLSEPLKKPLEYWQKFIDDYKVKFITIEEPMVAPSAKLGFTIDRVGMVSGKLTILDIKSGNVDKVTGLQLGGYALGYEELTKLKIRQRWVIKLTEKKYEVIPFKDDEEKYKFLTILSAYRIRKEYCDANN